MNSILERLNQSVVDALNAAFGPDINPPQPFVVLATNPKFGDYQSNVALPLAKVLGQQPRAIAQTLLEHLNLDGVCEPPQIAGPGFINFTLQPQFITQQLQQIQGDLRLGVSEAHPAQTIVVDFSSPNIAKEMHVGHLRSTIIGDAIARLLEFRGHDVLRLNHVGDWGTQFGMLITHLKTAYPQALTTSEALDIGDLVAFYKEAKVRFDADESFKKTAQSAVVQLQAGDSENRQAWELLCEQSRREFQALYDRLDIQLTERGESFYNDQLPAVVERFEQAGVLQEDAGAQCVFLEGFTNKAGDPLPLIIQKSDGGYNYATTDLAALQYRSHQDQADRILYVTDAGQANHFQQVFQAGRLVGILPEDVTAEHVPFGLVLGEDGKKLKTRSGETIRLKDLLDEAVSRARADLETRLEQEQREETEEFKAHVAQVVGLGAVKYADLSQNRTSSYGFSFDKMLALQGNTAPYLLYAYVRVQGISRKGAIDFSQISDKTSLSYADPSELTLAKHLLQLSDIVLEVERDLLPNRLCLYLYELSQKFNQFYDRCPILQADEPQRTSRLVLADLTARTLKLGLSLLGIDVLERM